MKALIEMRGVDKGYGRGRERTPVLCDIHLRVAPGELVAIVGYSGTGKSTLVSLLAGLTSPDRGEVWMDGRLVSGPRADCGVVFQNYSLLPWLTVYENVALAVDQIYSEESKGERRLRTLRAIETVNLTAARDKRPGQLSGGMRQRTSLARTLATRPRVLLLDEPLGALDALTRSVLQDQILEIWKAEGQTVILITNDVDEALYMADRVIPLSAGPGATLGPETEVTAARPRDRRDLQQCQDMRRRRGEIIHYLLEEKAKQRRSGGESPVVLPNIAPMDISMHRPSWFLGLRPKKRKVLLSAGR